MRGVMMYGPGDVRVEERDEPRVVEETDAIIRVSAACVCGSDLWPYRCIGADGVEWPAPMGHEYAGIVEEVGAAVETIEPGQFVVGSFWASDNTCELCRDGYHSACINRVPMGALGAQAELLRVPLADEPSSQHRTSLRTIWSPACSQLLTYSARRGSVRWRQEPAPAGRLPSSVTARWGCWPCWPPGSSARSGSSR